MTSYLIGVGVAFVMYSLILYFRPDEIKPIINQYGINLTVFALVVAVMASWFTIVWIVIATLKNIISGDLQ